MTYVLNGIVLLMTLQIDFEQLLLKYEYWLRLIRLLNNL